MDSINHATSPTKTNVISDYPIKKSEISINADVRATPSSSSHQNSTLSVNRMAHMLNNVAVRSNVIQANDENIDQQLSAIKNNDKAAMMATQSSSITAEFVANLLNKNPYEGS